MLEIYKYDNYIIRFIRIVRVIFGFLYIKLSVFIDEKSISIGTFSCVFHEHFFEKHKKHENRKFFHVFYEKYKTNLMKNIKFI